MKDLSMKDEELIWQLVQSLHKSLPEVDEKRLKKGVVSAVKSLKESQSEKKEEHPHIAIKTFGNFDVFVDGKLVAFRRSRAKELFAYLVDRQGSSITRAEAFALLWEEGMYDRSMQKQLDVIIRNLKMTLEEYGISEILESEKGSMRLVTELVECDLYKFLAGDPEAVASYRGEYMSAYYWASLTEGYVTRKLEDGA